MKLVLLICITFLISVSAKSKLVFEENFDTLNGSEWLHIVTAWTGDKQLVYYRNNRKNSYVENGILKLQPTLVADEVCDNTIQRGSISEPNCNINPCKSSAGIDCVAPVYAPRIEAIKNFKMTFGRLEIKAKMPRGDWITARIQLYPRGQWYGNFPASGQIDLMISHGNKNLTSNSGQSLGVDVVSTAMKWGPDMNHLGNALTDWKWISPVDLSDAFHLYKMEWTQNHLIFSIDDHKIGSVYPPVGGFYELGQFHGVKNPWSKPCTSRMAPFDKPFSIILSVDVCGTSFSDSMINYPYPKPWNDNSDHPKLQLYKATHLWYPTWDRPAMEVDYIRIYEL